MSKHLTDSERLHIVEEYLGRPGASNAIEKKYNIAQGLIRDHCTAFLRYDHWSFLTSN
ncbi:hypothetical protein [Porphyromonas gingivalis]|uniref:hypothetical protein n=1 Tax=Porphyromonas gingivalis TaxID=837 RepID=UPI0012FDFBE1|nr:hypothetical protein [Porphyromonas gingivalis]MCE8170957.1 hypothetical protein [Porphyromonas gingivalis]MCE8179676.1 hypothetical protein [Porphyromonas gingivalis]